MRKFLALSFCLIWFICVVLCGSIIFFRQLLENKKIDILGETLFFEKAQLDFTATRISLVIEKIHSPKHQLFINHYEHSLGLSDLLSLKGLQVSSVCIGEIEASIDKTIEELWKSQSKELSESLGASLSVQKCTLRCKDHTLNFKNLSIHKQVGMHCSGFVSLEKASAHFSLSQGFFRSPLLSVRWQLNQNSSFVQNIPHVKELNQTYVLKGTASYQFNHGKLKTSLSIQHSSGDINAWCTWKKNSPLTITFPTLDLEKINALSQNLVKKVTQYNSWSLKQINLAKTVVTVPFKGGLIDQSAVMITADITSGLVFIKDVFSLENIKGSLRVPANGWSVTVKSAHSKDGVTVKGYLDQKEASLYTHSSTSAAIDVFVRLNLLDSQMLSNIAGYTEGEIKFSTEDRPDWLNTFSGSFSTKDTSGSLWFSFLPHSLELSQTALKVSIHKQLITLSGITLWRNRHSTVDLKQRRQRSGLTALDIKVLIAGASHEDIRYLCPFLDCIQEGRSDIAVQIEKRNLFNDKFLTLLTAKASPTEYFLLKIPPLKDPLECSRVRVHASFHDGQTKVHSLYLYGPHLDASVSCNITPSGTTFSFAPSNYFGIRGLQGTITKRARETIINLHIPTLSFDVLSLINKLESSSSVRFFATIQKFYIKNNFLKDITVYYTDPYKKEKSAFCSVGSFKNPFCKISLYWDVLGDMKSFVAEGENFSDLLKSISGYKNIPFVVKNFVISSKKNKGEALKIIMEAKNISVPTPTPNTKSLDPSSVVKKEMMTFDTGSLEASYEDGLLSIEKIFMENTSLSVIAKEGFVDFNKSKIFLKGLASPFNNIKRGVAALSPTLAQTLYGTKVLGGSLLSIPFTIEEDFCDQSVSGFRF
ncbi:MAG: hypothetical protein OXC30_01660 [Alphaproteobacteria bacterium]|nr:hypothetical protein [Alphaproteobacteria bacterium]